MVVGVTDREVYPNASVVLVALEIRHPATAPLGQAAIAKIKKRLSPKFPIVRRAEVNHIQTTATVADVRVERFPKYFNRDSTAAISIREEALIVETTKYRHWEWLRELLKLAIEARLEATDVDGVERIGLRYIDEVRVPEKVGLSDWDSWVSPMLLGPSSVGEAFGCVPVTWQGVSVFQSSEQRKLVLRYGPREGYAVQPGGDLKRTTPPPSEFFLLDIDSFWERVDSVPEFDSNWILGESDDLHSPIRGLFESLITDRLRDEVLRRAT
jgi:uncharacterized protein (TIGR04255 family)